MLIVLLFITGCSNQFLGRTTHAYSNLEGVRLNLNIDEWYYTKADTFNSIKDCSSEKTPQCIIFNSTVLMLPTIDVLADVDNDLFEGRIDDLDLSYYIRRGKLEFLGESLNGFEIEIAQEIELHYGVKMVESLKSKYFYHKEMGILVFERNWMQLSSDGEKDRHSEVSWSVSKCGLFSTRCK